MSTMDNINMHSRMEASGFARNGKRAASLCLWERAGCWSPAFRRLSGAIRRLKPGTSKRAPHPLPVGGGIRSPSSYKFMKKPSCPHRHPRRPRLHAYSSSSSSSPSIIRRPGRACCSPRCSRPARPRGEHSARTISSRSGLALHNYNGRPSARFPPGRIVNIR